MSNGVENDKQFDRMTNTFDRFAMARGSALGANGGSSVENHVETAWKPRKPR